MQLFNPKDSISSKDGKYEEHATPIRKLLSQRSMRALGKAYDKGIIKEA
jgi:hypothetical protein